MDRVSGEVDRKRKLCEAIERQDCSELVVSLLMENGLALPDECELWDYKLGYPDYRALKGDDGAKKAFKAEEAELIKDCVAFYNSYGGYILFGFDNKTRVATGISGEFDTDEFKKKIERYTSIVVQVIFRLIAIHSGKSIAILFVPKRSYEFLPVQFRKPAPESENGKQAFARGAFYLRREAASRPIEKDDDLPFLSVKGKRDIHFHINVRFNEGMSNNLPARDPGLIELMSRRDYLLDLEKWFLDSFNGLRLLTGLGGYGKTAIARSFSEALVDNKPEQYELLIWLTAKTNFFVSLMGKSKVNSRIDFHDSRSLFVAALLQLGYLPRELDDKDKGELIDDFIALIRDIPVVVIIDDVDSLDIEEQYTVIGDLQKVSSVNVYSSKVPSKLLVTSRLDLGVSPELILPVKGFERSKGYEDYVKMSARSLNIDGALLDDLFLKNLYAASEGAPTFINGILRLISLGEAPQEALASWKGHDGEEVRRFAFERELRNLDISTSSVLYAAIILNNPTLTSIEAAIGINRVSLRDAIAKLRQYHLFVQNYDEGRKVIVIHLPESLRLMADVVRGRLPRATEIERSVSRINAELRKFSGSRVIGDVISEVVSRWKAGQTTEALEIANEALQQDPKSKELLSLVGRAYLKVVPPDFTRSEICLQSAYESGNSRIETINDWIRCKQVRRDWRGLIGVAKRVKSIIGAGASTYYVGMATAKIAENRMLERKIPEAAEKYRDAARLARDCLNHFEAEGRTKDLIELKNVCYELCVNAYMRVAASSGGAAGYKVWEMCFEALKAKVRSRDVSENGLSALVKWGAALGNQRVVGAESKDMLAYEAARLRELLDGKALHPRCIFQAERALTLLT